MAIIVPNTGSTYTADACIPNSANHWTWLGFMPSASTGGCMVWYQTASPTAGCVLLPIVCSAGNNIGLIGPFNSPCGFYAACINGGSAIIWMKAAS